ncbi:conserved hypothetical protein TIGR01725 [Brachybacterium faecium]|nr:conserved hypothetical protein TIGR01725 [Brachybacterium faecium]
MSNNQNGFVGMADYLGTISDISESNIGLSSLKAAADYYVDKLIPRIPKSLMKKKHMREHVKVVIEDEQIRVVFEDTAFYWRFAENGTVNQKAQRYASNTYVQYRSNIENLMSEKILKELRK